MKFATLLWVFIGGGLGSSARFLLGEWLRPMLKSGLPYPGFPWPTLATNVIGCALAGFLAARFGLSNPEHPWRAFILVGVLGGFTTFSAFGLESLTLVQQDQVLLAAAYVLVSLLAGLLAVWLGFGVGR
jgi:fluoride exporter